METLIIKRKEFEVLEKLGDRSYKVSRKGKNYFVKKLEPKSDEYYFYIYAASRMKSAMILTPRIKLADKKTGYVVSEYFEGQTVLDYLMNNTPDEDDMIYQKIFSAAHMAKINGMIIDFKPDQWIIINNAIMCMRYNFGDYSRELDFTQTDLKLWFITKDLAKYANEHGYQFDNSRIKDEYLTNKHIVLVTCKHYQ